MKKVVDYCDFCKEDFETKKCKICNSSLCDVCNITFPIRIGEFKINYGSFCNKSLIKLEFGNKKKGIELLKKIKEELFEELNQRVEKIKKRKQK